MTDLDASALTVVGHGAGAIRLSGEVDSLVLELDGTITFAAADLRSAEATTGVAGVASATL